MYKTFMKKVGMKNKSLILFGVILLSVYLLLWGCSGSGGSSGGNAADNNISDDNVSDDNVSDDGSLGNNISGVASKGIINGGLATAYAVNEDGTLGDELGSDLTDENGQYSIEIVGHNGPVLIEVTGGSYTDEATGATVDNAGLRAVIPSVNENMNVAVTPLTEIAVQIANSVYTVDQVNNANASVAVLIGGADITETLPLDINGDLSGATDEEKDYTMLLAAISQMVEDGSAADVYDAIATIKSDLADDGKLEVLQNGTGTGNILQDAIGNFVASPENNTGFTEEDITLDEALVEAADIGDTWQTATIIAPSATWISGNSIDPQADVDYFSIDLSANTGYWISTLEPLGGCWFDTKLTLYDTDGTTPLKSNDDLTRGGGKILCSQMRYKPTVSGTYFVKVESSGAYSMGTYKLQMADTDDIIGNSETLAVNGANSATYTDDDSDYWFHFSTVAGTVYTASIKNTTCVSGDESNLWLEVYEPTLTVKVGYDKEMKDGSCASFSFTASQTANYFIRVRQHTEPLYNFDVSVTSP